MQIYKSKAFARWVKSERIKDKQLRGCVTDIVDGLVDANLGSGLYKQRLARPGSGKRGGHRTLLAFKKGYRIFFLFGFSKNERGNIDDDQLKYLRELSKKYLNLPDKKIKLLLK